jgi:hypothetical protein
MMINHDRKHLLLETASSYLQKEHFARELALQEQESWQLLSSHQQFK